MPRRAACSTAWSRSRTSPTIRSASASPYRMPAPRSPRCCAGSTATGLHIAGLQMSQPSLDDVFLKYTGRQHPRRGGRPANPHGLVTRSMTGIAYETYHLGLRTTRRFIRVPANLISILFFPLIQLLVFSQLYRGHRPAARLRGTVELPRLPGAGTGRVHGVHGGRVVRVRPARRISQRVHRQAARQPDPPLVDPRCGDGAAVLPGSRHVRDRAARQRRCWARRSRPGSAASSSSWRSPASSAWPWRERASSRRC